MGNRPFQFSVAALLIGVTAVAVALAEFRVFVAPDPGMLCALFVWAPVLLLLWLAGRR